MKSIIFDFDGVLGNTLEPVSEFIAKISFQPKDRAKQELLKMLMTNHKENFFQRQLKDLMATPLENFLLKQPNILFTDRLEEIKNLGVSKAILSNNYSFICKKLLGEYANMFDVIVGDDISDTKVAGFELIFQNPKFDPEQTIFITDSVGDVLEAKKVLKKKNIYAVSWGFHSPQELSEVLPKSHILSDFSELGEILYETKLREIVH